MNINLQEFEAYLHRHYSNQLTINQYLSGAKRFSKLNKGILNQEGVDLFVKIHKKTCLNRAICNSLVKCFKVEDIDLPSSKASDKTKAYKFLEKEVIDDIIDYASERVSLMTQIYWETGLRLSELINIKKSKIDLVKKIIYGMGKRNKEFDVPISDNTATRLKAWIICNCEPDKRDKNYKLIEQYPFHYPKIKNHTKKFWRQLKMECRALGIEENMHPHRIRHSLGHHLRVVMGWDLEQVREKLRHESVNTTQIYSTATKEEVNRKTKEELFGQHL